MKTGRPEYYLPSPSTVSRDVRVVFARSRQRIAAMLRVSNLLTSLHRQLYLNNSPETRGKTSLCD